MERGKTKVQMEFDIAARKWALIRIDILRERLPVLREITERLPKSDVRREMMAEIERYAA